MTLNNFEEFKELAIKNSHALDEMLKSELPKVKEKSISPELKTFWNNFESKLNSVQSRKQGNQVLNAYIKLSEGRTMMINDVDNLEPWFVKITGVNCETGQIDQEILNSRKSEPAINIELVDVD
ncbi:MAG: hypothetical protein LBR15_10675 [Methanobrevibacter sp.]|jgi:hypothetical protein|nr:hypothetical protein [Candidatus Methanovirga australis]MDR2544519.1 hypothetical protein [Candidatus Methanovirga procula]